MRADALVLIAAIGLTGCAAPDTARAPDPGFRPATKAPNGVVGLDARALQRMFGKPRLDIRDPTARKLQFANDRCVLDAYLYAPGAGREPIVTFAEARSAAGTPTDTAGCAATLRPS